MPFLDRLISADMSDEAARRRAAEGDEGVGPASRPSPTEGLHEDEQAATRPVGSSSYFARAASVGAMMAPGHGSRRRRDHPPADRGGAS